MSDPTEKVVQTPDLRKVLEDIRRKRDERRRTRALERVAAALDKRQ